MRRSEETGKLAVAGLHSELYCFTNVAVGGIGNLER